MYEAIATTGGIIVKEGETPPVMLRCVSCGKIGNADLCDKCFKKHSDALDIHTDGMWSLFMKLHKAGVFKDMEKIVDDKQKTEAEQKGKEEKEKADDGPPEKKG